MRQIRIGFSRPIKNMIGSELIQWWMGRYYSHAFIQFTSERLRITSIYQAAHGMVHFREFNNFCKDNQIIKNYVIDLTDKQYDECMLECMRLAGEPYGYKELATILWQDFLFKLGIKVKSYNGRGYICSELVGTICIKILKIKFNKPTYLLTPADIDDALHNLNY